MHFALHVPNWYMHAGLVDAVRCGLSGCLCSSLHEKQPIFSDFSHILNLCNLCKRRHAGRPVVWSDQGQVQQHSVVQYNGFHKKLHALPDYQV